MIGLVELTPRQKIAVYVIGVLVLVLVSFSAGRFSAPEQVREVERWKTLDLTTEDVTRGMTFAKDKEVTRWRKKTTTPTPAGPLIVEESGEREGNHEQSASTETGSRTEQHSGELAREKTTTLQADWRIGVQVGAAIKPALVITGPLVLGASVERRIIGGVSAGVWGNTVGAGGASVSVEF